MNGFHPAQPQRSHSHLSNILVVIVVLLAAVSIPSRPTSAIYFDHIYDVDVTFDSSSATYQGCTTGNTSDCSLRGAVMRARADSISDYILIDIPAGTYNLTLSGVDDDNTHGDLDIQGPYVEIHGDGIDLTTIHSGGVDRVIDHSGTKSLKLVDLEINGGAVLTGNGGGGGIRSTSTATLTLDTVRVTGNHVSGTAQWDSGGGIYANNTTLVLTGGTEIDHNNACNGGGILTRHITVAKDITITQGDINNNTAQCGDGGGILTTDLANLYITNSQISYNYAKRGAGYYQSGGTYAEFTDVEIFQNAVYASGTGAGGLEIYGAALLEQVDIHHNYGTIGPGGMMLNEASSIVMRDSYMHANGGDDAGAILVGNNTDALLERVTITNNLGVDKGGGITVGTDGNIELENVTISGNTTDYGGGLYIGPDNESAYLDHVTIAFNDGYEHGDAVYIATNGHWYPKNSIFYSENPSETCHYAGSAFITSMGHNLENSTNCLLSGIGDLHNTDPLLGMLGLYGFNMPILPLSPGSPAIDAALTSDPLSTDQRGMERADGDFNGSVVSDIGAYEYYPGFFLPIIRKP